ncbi:MAG: hypothetical protein Q9225_003751 [Loekoesia sp. 1 TL-2023]
MYGPLLAGISMLVTALLAYLNPGAFLNTLGSGKDSFSAGTILKNPLTTKGIFAFADYFVSLQADYIIPAILPGATSVGRPYIVQKAVYLANAAVDNQTYPPVPDYATSPNLLYPMVSPLDEEAPREITTPLSVWVGFIALFSFLVIAFGYTVYENMSLRGGLALFESFVSELCSFADESNADSVKRLDGLFRTLKEQGFLRDSCSENLSKSQMLPPITPLLSFSNKATLDETNVLIRHVVTQIGSIPSTIERADIACAKHSKVLEWARRLTVERNNYYAQRDAALAKSHKLDTEVSNLRSTIIGLEKDAAATYEQNLQELQNLTREDKKAQKSYDEEIKYERQRSKGLETELDVVQRKLDEAEDQCAANYASQMDCEASYYIPLPETDDSDLIDQTNLINVYESENSRLKSELESTKATVAEQAKEIAENGQLKVELNSVAAQARQNQANGHLSLSTSAGDSAASTKSNPTPQTTASMASHTSSSSSPPMHDNQTIQPSSQPLWRTPEQAQEVHEQMLGAQKLAYAVRSQQTPAGADQTQAFQPTQEDHHPRRSGPAAAESMPADHKDQSAEQSAASKGPRVDGKKSADNGRALSTDVPSTASSATTEGSLTGGTQASEKEGTPLKGKHRRRAAYRATWDRLAKEEAEYVAKFGTAIDPSSSQAHPSASKEPQPESVPIQSSEQSSSSGSHKADVTSTPVTDAEQATPARVPGSIQPSQSGDWDTKDPLVPASSQSRSTTHPVVQSTPPTTQQPPRSPHKEHVPPPATSTQVTPQPASAPTQAFVQPLTPRQRQEQEFKSAVSNQQPAAASAPFVQPSLSSGHGRGENRKERGGEHSRRGNNQGRGRGSRQYQPLRGVVLEYKLEREAAEKAAREKLAQESDSQGKAAQMQSQEQPTPSTAPASVQFPHSNPPGEKTTHTPTSGQEQPTPTSTAAPKTQPPFVQPLTRRQQQQQEQEQELRSGVPNHQPTSQQAPFVQPSPQPGRGRGGYQKGRGGGGQQGRGRGRGQPR